MTAPSTDDTMLGEAEHVETSEMTESTNVDDQHPIAEDNTENPAPTAEEAAAQAAKAEADAKAKAEADAAEQARIDGLVADFKKLIGTKDEAGNWTGGLMASDTGRDASTGAIPDGVQNTLKGEFNKLPAGAARREVRTWVDDELGKAMESFEDPSLARTLFTVKQNVLVNVNAAKPTPEVKIVDPTEAHVSAVTALYLAPYARSVPAGIETDWSDRVQTRSAELMDQLPVYADWLAKGEELATKANAVPTGDEHNAAREAVTEEISQHAKAEPDVASEVKEAFRIARGRPTARLGRGAKPSGTSSAASVRPTSNGTKRNIATHISNAFATKPVGTFLTIAEIVNTASDEYAGISPSPGAVSARLFPDGDPAKCTVAGIKGAHNADGKKGAVKVA